MALPINDAAMLVALSSQIARKEQVVCLGEPLLGYSFTDLATFCKAIKVDMGDNKVNNPTMPLTAKAFFTWLGFEKCISLDISDYEGAEIVHNLNSPDLDVQYHGIADLIIDAGTLEHVFHLPNALLVIHKVLRTGGMVYHHNPSNGYLDHGFYQISPTLYYDYYRENKYEVVSANLINRYGGAISSEPYTTDVYRNKGMFYSIERLERCTISFLAKKADNSTTGQIPTQTFYRQIHTEFRQKYENKSPFSYKVSSLSDKLRFYFPSLVKLKKKLLRKK